MYVYFSFLTSGKLHSLVTWVWGREYTLHSVFRLFLRFGGNWENKSALYKCITKFAVLCPYSNQQAFYSACTGKKTLKPSFVFYKLTHNVLSPNHDLQPNLHSDVSQASIAVWCPHSNLQTIFSGNKLIVYILQTLDV